MDPKLKELLDQIAAAQKAMDEKQVEATKGLQQAQTELKETGEFSKKTADETKAAFAQLNEMKTKFDELTNTLKGRMDGLEALFNRPGFGTASEPKKSIGQVIVESEAYKSAIKSGSKNLDKIEMKSLTMDKKDEVPSGTTVEMSTSGVGLTGPGQFVPGPIMLPMRKALLRNILGSRTTTSDIVWFAQETGFAILYTVSTAISGMGASAVIVENPNGFYIGQTIWVNGEQKVVTDVTLDTNRVDFTPAMLAQAAKGSAVVANDYAPTAEGMLKPASQINFTPLPVYIKTIASTLTVSNQLLADAPGLMNVLNTKLPYAMLISEEVQILYGDEWSDSVQLPGLFNQPSMQHYLWSSGAVTDTQFDAIRKGIALAELAQYDVDFVLVNTTDLCNMELIKDLDGQYISKEIIKTNPDGSQTIWGKPMIRTNAVLAGHALIGSTMAASIIDREMANVRIFEQHEDYAKRNLLLVRGEERLGLEVGRPEAFVDVFFDHAPGGSGAI